MNDKMYESLLRLFGNRELVSIYDDPDNTENFSCGFISAINEEDVVIQHINPNGHYDGFILKKTSGIFQIGYQGLYQVKISKLNNIQAKKHSEIQLNDDLKLSLLKYAKLNNFVVSLELNESGVMDIQGFVSELDEDNIVVNLLTEYGISDGISSTDIKCLSRIDCDTEQEQMLKLLADMQRPSN